MDQPAERLTAPRYSTANLSAPKNAGNISLQDWFWTFAWPVAAIVAGAFSLWELLLTNRYHPWGPVIGLGLSGVSILTWLTMKGPAKPVLGVLAILGLLMNLAAGVVILIALTH